MLKKAFLHAVLNKIFNISMGKVDFSLSRTPKTISFGFKTLKLL